MSKYVVLNLSSQEVISLEFATQEEALKHIEYINSFRTSGQDKANLAVLLVGSSTHKELTGL